MKSELTLIGIGLIGYLIISGIYGGDEFWMFFG
jgi:hypothetical protein